MPAVTAVYSFAVAFVLLSGTESTPDVGYRDTKYLRFPGGQKLLGGARRAARWRPYVANARQSWLRSDSGFAGGGERLRGSSLFVQDSLRPRAGNPAAARRPELGAAKALVAEQQPQPQPGVSTDPLAGMRYWEKAIEHARQDPLPVTDKFISFEPWNGGFNNIRMSIEFAAALAWVTNRTLVIPDKYNMYKLPGVNDWSDFFDLDHLGRGVPLIQQSQFQSLFSLPNPNGRTAFDAQANWDARNYRERGWVGVWEKSISYGFGEDVGGKHALQAHYVYCAPTCPQPGQAFHNDLQKFRTGFTHHPLVNTAEWENSPIVHFSQNGLGHWYTSIFIRPKTDDIKLKLFMRNHFHFNEGIFTQAEKVLRRLLDETSSFSCMHVRRGDFQFKETFMEVPEMMENTKALFRPNEHLWIMTEDPNPDSFFADMKSSYQVHFLKDYMNEIPGTPASLLPMIESVICSRARVFSGTFLSTMSGYVTRLRGYMTDVQDKTVYFNQMKYPEDYEGWDNKYPTWAYTKGPKGKNGVHAGVPNWGREFREVWDLEWDLNQG